MQSPQKKSKDLERLFSAFPPINVPDPDEALRRYFEAVEDFHADDLTTAVTLFITGRVAGFDGRFVPTPPMLAGACRQAAAMRQREAYIQSFSAPRLPAPTIEKTDDQRARAREKMQQAIEALACVNVVEKEADTAAAKERWAKVNARFQPDMSDAAIMDRLIRKRGYSVGDDAEDAA